MTESAASSRKPRVINVGQCSFDTSSIETMLKRNFGASVVSVDDGAEAREELSAGECDLVLVNRQLDMDGSSGLAVIRNLMKDWPEVRYMLVSNYADAQEQAIAIGAVPGFGKSALNSPETIALLSGVLGPAQSA